MTALSHLAEMELTQADQLGFAAISGDYNPVHVDAVIARRTQFGRQIAHGMHLVLWALDRYLASFEAKRPARLIVRFLKPAFVGDAIRVRARDAGNASAGVTLDIKASDATAAVLALSFDAPSDNPSRWPENLLPCQHSTPQGLRMEDVDGREGYTCFAAAGDAVRQAFPMAVQVLGLEQVSSLLAASRVVGMECPGMDSVLAGMTIRLDAVSAPRASLAWRVANVDHRIRKIDLEVSGGGISGRLETFMRAPPVPPLSMQLARTAVAQGEFTGHSPLIVGGSRGLGEATAKIVAAGGGSPIITYNLGKTEAERCVEDIRAAGGQCSMLAYDVRLPATEQLAPLTTAPDSFYYFATCSIFQRKAALYEPQLMREFVRFFVDGLYELAMALRERRSGKLVGFYPSTVALDERLRELTEYCLAKHAGEMLCERLAWLMDDAAFVVRRLPRVATDQTSTILPVQAAQPLDVMLPIIREVRAESVT